jgi:glucose-1-phosphate thymidylyltransferase
VARAASRAERYLYMILKGVIMPAPVDARADSRANAALQRVGNRPIVCHALEAIRRAGASEVALIVSARELSAVQACVAAEGPTGIEVTYVPHVRRPDAVKEALTQAVELVGDAPCIVHAADGLLAQPLEPLVELLRAGTPNLVMLVHRRATSGGSIGLSTRRLLRLVGEPTRECELELAGACLFGPGALRHAARARWWQRGELDLAGVSQRLAQAGGLLQVEHVRGWRRYGGTAADLLELNRLVLEALVSADRAEPGAFGSGTRHAAAGDDDSRIEGCVQLDPTACVQSSVIVGPAVVGPGALVQDSYIGPYTSIGAGVHIEGAEIERSIILPRASITHIGGRLVGSVVGYDARVFRDFSLPRALRLNVGDGGEVALC